MSSRAELKAQLRVIPGGRAVPAPGGPLLVDAIEAFLVAGRQVGWSPTTHKQYAYHLERLRQWLADHGIEDIEDVDRYRLRQWGAEIRERWQPATVRGAVKVVKRFFAWCHEEGLAKHDLSGVLKTPRVPKKIQRTVTPEEVQRMLAICDSVPSDGMLPDTALAVWRRNGAIVSLLFDSLLRVSELVRLTVDNVDLNTGRLVVVRKGGDQKPGFFGRATAKRLQAWLEVRPALPDVKALFTTIGADRPGRPLSVHGVREMLTSLSERAGIPHVTPHSFRRGGACAATMLGASTHVIMALGGWESESMVLRYTRALAIDEIAAQYSPMDCLAEKTGSQDTS